MSFQDRDLVVLSARWIEGLKIHTFFEHEEPHRESAVATAADIIAEGVARVRSRITCYRQPPTSAHLVQNGILC